MSGDQFSPVTVFAHDYGTHHYWCEIITRPTRSDCTCGFRQALDLAVASEAQGGWSPREAPFEPPGSKFDFWRTCAIKVLIHEVWVAAENLDDEGYTGAAALIRALLSRVISFEGNPALRRLGA